MYIKEIEIDNFKSFADKTTIPFLEGFTTVSGPNGSGKSNIIDSVLFALGLSSSRTLRAERISHLINNHNKRSDASVKITFSKNDNTEEISITRKIRKSGQNFISSYYMDEKPATLTEIHSVLSEYNISPGSYNVMMQGDVTGIINMTPFERRKILDEIAGVADFDRRIEQAKKELETVENRVEKSNIILNEIDIRLSQLEEERDQALKYQQLKSEKQKFEDIISVAKYFDAKNSLERLHESILDANKSKKDHFEKQKELNITLENLKVKFKEIADLVKTKGENEQIEIKKQIETYKGVVARKKDAIAYIDKQVADNNASNIAAKDNIQKLKEKIEETNIKIDNKNDEIKVIQKNIETEKEELERVINDVSDLNNATNEHVERRNQLRRNLEQLKDKENAVLKDKLVLEEKVLRYQRDIDEAKKEIADFDIKKSEFFEQKDLIDVQINELSQELKDFEIAQKNCLFDLDKTKNELNDINYDINLAYRKITQLEANKRAADDANFGRAIDTIMNAGLEGIHAPLAQLGQVNKEYSTALEIAMGGRMRFIVVDDDDVGSRAIQILKTSNAGRATFLPINKMKPMPRNMRLPDIDGVIDFAINLVDFDDQYCSVFYYALGETIIVEDLNVSRKLIGKYRMVTLDGSLVEKTGAMTGGSISRSGIKFAQAENEELNTFKERLEILEKKGKELERNKLNIESKLDKIRIDYSEVNNSLTRKKMELENLVKNLRDKEASANAKQILIEELTPTLNESSKTLSSLEEKLEILANQISQLAQDIETVEKTIPKDELDKLSDLTENIEFEIKQQEAKLNNCNNDVKAFKMEINYHNEAIKTHEERIEKIATDNVSLAQEKEVHKISIVDTEQVLHELNEKINNISEELVGLQQERDSISEEILNLEKRKSLSENKIERLQEQIEAFKTRRKELEGEIFNIKEEITKHGQNLTTLTKPEISIEEVNKNIIKLQHKMEELEPVNMKALVDYDEVSNRKQELKTKIDTLSNERTQIIERMDGYEDLKLKSFLDTFNNVNGNFQQIFAQLSDGIGNLILENTENPFTGGLTIEAQPRGKKAQRLESMSGGEKSLTALAFVFAIQRYMPAPFYAFDEVDMHLDGINAEKLAQMIKYQSSNTQFIVVSLRKPMIESADRTIGVTQKNSGITKVTGVRLNG